MISLEKNISKELIYNLEKVERNAWIDFYKSASNKTAEHLGIKYESFGSADISIVSGKRPNYIFNNI